MAIFHYDAGGWVSRKSGGSAVASAAYQCRECFKDERTGEWYDYRAKVEKSAITAAWEHDALHAGQKPAFAVWLYGPAGAVEWTRGKENIATFWNRAEAAEKHPHAQIAERYIAALPHELVVKGDTEKTIRNFRWLLQDHVREFTRQGRVVQVSIHWPEHDGRNFHVHLLVSTRGVNEYGFNQYKAREQQQRYLNRDAYLHGLRQNWEKVVNRHLERHGFEARIDHRSLRERGLKLEPAEHYGPVRAAKYREEMEEKAERQRQAIDQSIAKAHEPPQKAEQLQTTAEVIELPEPERASYHEQGHERPTILPGVSDRRPEPTIGPYPNPECLWFAGIVEGWHQPGPSQQEQPAPAQADHLAQDLLRAITSALGTRDPGEQIERLTAGVDRAVYVHGGNPDEPPSELGRSLMRVATSALSVAEPERILIEGTGEAIRRHELRQQQAVQTVAIPQQQHTAREERARAYWQELGEIGRRAAPRQAQQSTAPDPRLITDRAEVERLQREAYLDRNQWASPLTITDVARELSPRFKAAADTRNQLYKEDREAKKERQRWADARDSNMKAQKHREAEMSWWRRLLHRNGLKPDMILAEYERGDWEAQTRLVELRRADAERQPKISAAVEAYKAALGRVYDHAEKELNRRITVATEARRRLEAHYAARQPLNQHQRPRHALRM